MKPSGIGGMAVMEGVMMKNKDEYAVAVRKPNNEIAVEKSTHKDFSDKVKLFKLPIFRGMLAFVDSMVIGVKVLNFSASFFEEEEETLARKEKEKKQAKKNKTYDEDFEMEDVSATKKDTAKKDNGMKEEKSNALLMVFAVLFSIVLSISLFMVLPVLITGLFSSYVTNKFVNAFIEGIIRLVIFIGYVILASRMKEIKRVFMYHGAEHKTINCLENGLELTVENVKKQSKQHKRCGTSFMLLVILISLVFFIVVPVTGLIWRVVSRVLFVPFIAGVSYEFIRLAGKSESKLVDVLSQPGLWMQGLTTKEPEDDMIEVAIKSVDAVFDWRAFLNASEKESKSSKVTNMKSAAATGKQASAVKQQSTSKQQSSLKQQGSVELNNADTIEQNPKKDQVTAAHKLQDISKVNNSAQSQTISKQEPEVKSQSVTKMPAPAGEKEAVKASEKKQEAPAKNEIKAKAAGNTDKGNRNPGIAPINFKPATSSNADEEDDEILRALDKFFDNGARNKDKAENE